MIGGEHFLRPPSPVEDSLGEMLERDLGHVAFYATGRDALATLLATLPGASVMLPDLMCASVHDACRAAGKTREIYRIGSDFMHEEGVGSDWPAPAIVVMHYFGMRNDTLMRRARSAGMTVVSDVTHLLLDRAGLLEAALHSDFLIASLRKSGAFPDGGFISSLAHMPPQPSRGLRESFLVSRAAGLLSRGFSAAQDFLNDENFLLLKRAEESLDASEPGSFACSYLSRRLAHTVSVSASAAAIRRNVAVLAAGLRGRCIILRDDTAVTPYFPCVFDSRETRDRIRKALAAQRFYFPVHWPDAGLHTPSPLAALSLSIPCDARYDEPAMRSVLKAIESCLSR